jgi:hypothetical protein
VQGRGKMSPTNNDTEMYDSEGQKILKELQQGRFVFLCPPYAFNGCMKHVAVTGN